MKKGLVAGGLILLIITATILPRTITEYNIYKSPQIGVVKVLKLPNCEAGYKNKFMTIRFEEKIYTLRTKCKYTKNLSIDQNIPMLYSKGSDIFLFPQENPTLELGACLLLGVIGITIIVVGLFKK
jgi:hypothetical protein